LDRGYAKEAESYKREREEHENQKKERGIGITKKQQ